MPTTKRDYYEILGVPKGASVDETEIKLTETQVAGRPIQIGVIRSFPWLQQIRKWGRAILLPAFVVIAIGTFVRHPEYDAPDPKPAAEQQVVNFSASSTTSGTVVIFSGF